jgi:hypothetical protein
MSDYYEFRDKDNKKILRVYPCNVGMINEMKNLLYVNGIDDIAQGSKEYWEEFDRPKKKRLMTIKELWGKTLVGKMGSLVAINRVDLDGRIKMINAWSTVAEAHLDDFKVAGPDLDYETATSLEVEK